MSLDAWVGVIATVGTTVAAIVVSIWLEFRKKHGSETALEPIPPAVHHALASVAVTRLEKVRASGVLRCGVINHPPLSAWQQEAGAPVFSGYYVELAREVGVQEGLEIEFVAVSWGVLSSSFTSLDLDLVLSIFETRARLQFADFVACLHKVGVSGVMRASDEPLTEVSQLSDPALRVGTVVGEVGWEYVTQELKLPRLQLVQVDSDALRTAFSPLISGDADIAIVDDLTCAQFVSANPGYQHVFADDSLYVCKNSIMVPRGETEFARWVDESFLAARQSPPLQELESTALKETGGWVKRFR